MFDNNTKSAQFKHSKSSKQDLECIKQCALHTCSTLIDNVDIKRILQYT